MCSEEGSVFHALYLGSEVIPAAVICACASQVLGVGCICAALPAGTDMVVWPVLPQ